MNLKTLMKSVLMTALLLGMMSIASFAQVYVNNTDGDDYVGQGTQLSPYRTITKGIEKAPAGGIVYIAADTYNESDAVLNINKAVTLVATTYNGLSVVTIANGVNVTTPNATDVVNLGRTADNSVKFVLGSNVKPVNVTNLAYALVLTKGNLKITSTNVTVFNNGTITRIDGTLDNAPTVTNVNVVYNSTTDVTAGGELPVNIGTGSLKIDITAGKTVTSANGLTSTGGVTIVKGNVSFAGDLNLTTSSFTNQPAGNTVALGGNVVLTTGSLVNKESGAVTVSGSFTSTTGSLVNEKTGAVTVNGSVNFTTGHITNLSTGTVAVNGNAIWTIQTENIANAVDNSGNGTVTLAGNVSFVKSSTGAGTPVATINNGGTGTVTLAKGFTLTSAAIGSPAVTYTPTVHATNGAGSLVFNGAVSLTNLTNANGSVLLTGGTVAGTFDNNSGGTVELASNLTFSGAIFGNNAAASVVKLNSNTLTLSKDGVGVNNAGKIISTTAATVGAGTLAFTANGTVSAGTELPNITLVASKTLTVGNTPVYGSITNNGTMTVTSAKVYGSVTNAGTFTSSITAIAGNVVSSGAFTQAVALTLDGDFTSTAALTLQDNIIVKGNYAQNVGASLALNATTFEVWGNWIRKSNVPGDVTYLAGAKVKFNKGNAQVFNPGASLKLYDVLVTKDANTVVTLNQSLEMEHDFNITSGKVDLGDFNIRMVGNNGFAGQFANEGNFYSTTGNGFLIFEGTNNPVFTIRGAGIFSNMDIRNNSTVNAATDINFSGKLILRDGTLAIGAHAFTYKSDIMAVPTVTRYVENGRMTVTDPTKVTVAPGVLYDLTYMGSASKDVDQEWIENGIRNLTIATGDATHSFTTTRPSNDFTIAGNLTVNQAQTFDLNGKKVTFSADGKTHTVVGKVANGLVEVTGDGVKIVGSTVEDALAYAEIPSLYVNTSAAKSFTSTDIKRINGYVTVENGASTINMNVKKATVEGLVTLKAGSLNLNMNASETSVHNNGITVTSGTLTYTRGADAPKQQVNGPVTLTEGTLVLGSNLTVNGLTSQAKGNLNLNGFTYTQKATNYTRTDAGTVASNGTVVFEGPVTVVPGTNFVIANVEFKNAVTITAPMTISNTLTHTSGLLDLNTLTFSGTAYNFKAGATYAAGNKVIFTGANSVVTLDGGDMTLPKFELKTDGTVTLASNNATARTLFVTEAYTMTKGNFATGINNVEISNPATFTRVAGTWAQTSGFLTFNTTNTTSIGDGFAVDNFALKTSADLSDKVFGVNKYLLLAGGTLTTSADGKLQLGNDVVIERQSDATVLAKVPTFGQFTSVLYSTNAGINTAKELPAAVKNFTVVTPASVTLQKNVTVNNTLKLSGALDINSTDRKMTMADNSTVDLLANGLISGANLTKAGDVNVIYEVNTTVTSTRELGDAYTAYNVTVKDKNVTLQANTTIKGQLTLNTGTLDINGKTLTLKGDMNEVTDNTVFNSTGTLVFGGSANQNIYLKKTRTVPSLNITLQKDNSGLVTMNGGNFDLTAKGITFVSGLLVTGNNNVVLNAKNDVLPANNNAQGYVRNVAPGAISHIVGNVVKALDHDKTNPAIIFPVGSTSSYRPVTLTFNPTVMGISTVPAATLTVSHVNTTPTGTVGLPIADGVSKGVDVARYPEFYWTIAADPTTSPSIVFDLELGSAGFTGYDDVNNVRIIRRNGLISDVTNQWLLQGGAAYDNRVVANDPTIVVRGANAGLVQAAVYTLGLKTNMKVLSPIADQNLFINDIAKINLNSPKVFGGNTGSLTYSQQSSNEAVAKAAFVGDTLKVTALSAGSAVISVTATDQANNDFITTQFNVVVNKVTNFAVSGKVNYDNTAVTALKDVVVTLTPGNYTATTNATGDYAFASVPNGTYTVTATTTNAWLTNAVNSADALLAAQFTVDPVKYPLSVLRQSAADVNNDGKVNSTDALLIMRRTVKMDSTFAKGNWTFTSKSISVNGAPVVAANLSGLAIGDVNGSATFTNTLAKVNNFVNEGSVKVNAGTAISVPVKVDAENLAALTLSFKYSKDLGTFAGISSKLNGILANEVDGVVTVAWADLSAKNAVNVSSDEAFITLNFKASEAFKAGKSFSIDMNSAELVNADGNVIKNAMLKASSVDAVVPSEFALKQNYPNPFNPSTTISYDLPVNSKVILVVRNILGQEVATLVNGVQEAGSYKVQFNANNMTSGIYFYTLNVSNGDQKFTQTYKMILMK